MKPHPTEPTRIIPITENDLSGGIAKNGPWRGLFNLQPPSLVLVIEQYDEYVEVDLNRVGIVTPVNQREFNFFMIQTRMGGKLTQSGFTCSHRMAELFRMFPCSVRFEHPNEQKAS